MRFDRQELAVRMAALYSQGGLAYARNLAKTDWRGAARRNVGKDSVRAAGWWRDALAAGGRFCVWGLLAPFAEAKTTDAALGGYERFLHAVGDRFASGAVEGVHRDLLSAWRLAGLLPVLPRFAGTRAGMHGQVGLAMNFGAMSGQSWVWGNTGIKYGGGGTPALRPSARRDPVARRGYVPFLEAAMTLAHEAAHTVFGGLHAPLRLAPEHPGHEAVRGLNRSLLGTTARIGTNEHARAMDEMFADTYGAMLVLETFGHGASVIEELALFRDIRAANSKAFHASLVEASRDGNVPTSGARGGGPGVDTYGTAPALTRVLEAHADWQGRTGPELIEIARGIVSECWFEQFVGRPSLHGMTPTPGGLLAIGAERQVILNPDLCPLLPECSMCLVYEGREGVLDMLERCEMELGKHPYIDFWRDRFSQPAFDEWAPRFDASGVAEALRETGKHAQARGVRAACVKVFDKIAALNVDALVAWRKSGVASNAAALERQELAQVFMSDHPGTGFVAEREAQSLQPGLRAACGQPQAGRTGGEMAAAARPRPRRRA